jgi:cell division protein ZapA
MNARNPQRSARPRRPKSPNPGNSIRRGLKLPSPDAQGENQFLKADNVRLSNQLQQLQCDYLALQEEAGNAVGRLDATVKQLDLDSGALDMAMRTVIATVQGKDYTLACDAGQEQHLAQLVTEVNARAATLMQGVGKLSEPMLLLYTALMLADELHETTRENANLKRELTETRRQVMESGDDARIAALEEGMAESLHALATRIEGIAEKLSVWRAYNAA